MTSPQSYTAPVILFSPSAAETFQQCARKAMFNHYLSEHHFSEVLHKGQAVHATIRDACQVFQRAGIWLEEEDLLPILQSHLSLLPVGESSIGLEWRVEEWMAELLPCLRGWVRFATGYILTDAILGVEEWIEVDISTDRGKVRAKGRIDLVLRVEQEIWVLDLKTGRPPEDSRVSGPLAMALYSAYAPEMYPGARVRGYELYLATDKLVEYQSGQIEADLNTLTALAQAHFVETEWPRSTGRHCDWCDHFQRCFGENS